VELPPAAARPDCSHVLVVEHFELLGDEQTKAAYQSIDVGLLTELCTVLFNFRGMDSNAKNIPFSKDGRIALIDTEHWNRNTSKDYLHHVGEYMTAERQKTAKRIFRQLEDGRDVLRHFADDGPRNHRDFIEDEDTRSSLDDFADEEDTSSTSSSSS
jgi:hypothetical protein